MRILFFDLCTVLYTILCNNPLKHSSTARMLTKRSYRCRLRPAQLQEKTIEKNKKERTKRRHESTATTTTVVPPLRHRCATLTTNAASYLRMQMLGSVAKSIKHSTWASTLNFSPAWCRYLDLFPYSNVFNFFFLFLISDMPWLYFMATTTGYTDKTIKRGYTYKRSAMGHTTQTTAKVALPVQFFKNDRRWMCPIQFHFQNVDATVRVELQIVFFCSFAAAARTGLTGQCIVHFVKNWVAHFHSFVVHCFVGPEKQKGLKQSKSINTQLTKHPEQPS